MARSAALALPNPAALVAAVPHLLGFIPQDSIVAVVTDDSGLVLVCVRMDIPRDVDLDLWAEHLSSQLQHVSRIGPTEVRLVTFLEGALTSEIAAGALAASKAFELAGIDVTDELMASEDSWQQAPWVHEDQEQVAAGIVTNATREHIARALGTEPAQTRQEIVEGFSANPAAAQEVSAALASTHAVELGGPEEVERLVATLFTALSNPVSFPSTQDMAELLAALRDTRVRDTLIYDLMVCDVEDAAQVYENLEHVLRASPKGQVAPVATLTATVLMRSGDGLRCTAVLERALEDEPNYSLARLLLAGWAQGLPPAKWVKAAQEMSREVVLRGLGPPTKAEE